MSDMKFVGGVYVEKSKFGFRLSVEKDAFSKFFNENSKIGDNGKSYLNIEVNESKGGNAYAKLNEWEPEEGYRKPAGEAPVKDDDDDDLPF